MKLLLPEIIKILQINRSKLNVIPKMLKAQKFIYESVSDQDLALVTPIHETSEEMIDWNIFHLPSPLIWVEDLVDVSILHGESPEVMEALLKERPEMRHCYLAEEFPDRITVEVFKIAANPPWYPQKWAVEAYLPDSAGQKRNTIFLNKDRPRVPVEDSIGEAPFALRDLLVTLATPQAHREEIVVSRHNETKPITERHYSHTVVKVKSTPQNSSNPSVPTGRRKAQEFVPGYVWGKHTRPREGQRWINPYFRGDPDLGRARPKDHYEVERT